MVDTLSDALITDLTPYIQKLPKHLHVQCDIWTIAKFRQDGISFRSTNIIDEFEKWQQEFLDKPTTTTRPTDIQVLFGQPKPKIICEDLPIGRKFEWDRQNNVLSLTGLTESAKRDAGLTATTVLYAGTGTGQTAEDESQSALVTELSVSPYARKNLSTSGQRKVVNQTAKYGITWLDTDLTNSPPITLYEDALFTTITSGVMHARVLHNAFQVNSGDLYVTQLSELHANGVL